MESLKVLVTGFGGDVARGVAFCLKQLNMPIQIIGCGSSVDSPDLIHFDKVMRVDKISSKEYTACLIRIIRKLGIDLLVPTIDGELSQIACIKDDIAAINGCQTFVGDSEDIHLYQDKLASVKFLKQKGLAAPKTERIQRFESIDQLLAEFDLPVVLKPRWGGGSRGVKIVKCQKDLSFILSQDRDNFLIQECLDANGPEFTTGVYKHRHHGAISQASFERVLYSGSTSFARSVFHPDIEREIVKISDVINLPYFNIQWRWRNNRICPFEINPRMSGSTLAVLQIFNPLFYFINEVVFPVQFSPIIHKREVVMVRGKLELVFGRDEYGQVLAAKSIDDNLMKGG